MLEFLIDATDFGIDIDKSSFFLANIEGRTVVTVEVKGCAERYRTLTEDENGEWSWTLYPPHFYLRNFPIDLDENGLARARVTLDDLNGHDAGIYFMEHGDIDDVDLVLVPDRLLEISGSLSLFGQHHDFVIKWAPIII